MEMKGCARRKADRPVAMANETRRTPLKVQMRQRKGDNPCVLCDSKLDIGHQLCVG